MNQHLNRNGTDVNMVKHTFDEMVNLARKIVNERIERFDANNCQNLIDFWIKESSGPNAEYFRLKHLPKNIAALLMDATDPSSGLLYHCLHLMALHRNIQQKVCDEIDCAIGNDGLFSFSDRERLPYTQAVICEVKRFICDLPLFPHVNR
ncbi:cytochrome P450 2J5-like protein, partial [Leptotrombidium deliense]